MRITHRISASYLQIGLLLLSASVAPSCAKAQTRLENTPQVVPAATPTPFQPPNYARPGDIAAAPDNADGTSQLTSSVMGRNMPYRVILPANYETETGERYPAIYLLHGLTGNYRDWIDRTKLKELAAKYRFIIVTPEGGDGWYSDSPIAPHEMYESYIIKELISEINRRFRTLPDREHTVIAGLSMGGYGALKFGFRYPKMFAIVGSFSGAFVTGRWSESVGGNKLIGKSLDKVYGPLDSEPRRREDIFNIARSLSPEKSGGLPYIYLSCGTEDIFIRTNREFLAILNEKALPNESHFTRGNHTWTFWGEQIGQFLEVVDSRLKDKGPAKD